jgi:hypothetical protein
MTNEYEIRALAKHFRELGAHDPDSWAKSQINEGIPQFARFVFLKQSWTNVVADGDVTWIDKEISNAPPGAPGSGAGQALKRLLAAGASKADIAELVRVMQWQVLAGMAYQLSDPSIVDYPSKDTPRVNWALFEVDDDGQPLHEIGGLHESVLETDPTGREMRPPRVGA